MPNYSKRHGLVLGFHGCDESVAQDVLTVKNKHLDKSENTYDWLGHGIYFWEHDYDRALKWAKENQKVKKPAVIGAIIDLGNCLDLLSGESRDLLISAHKVLSSVGNLPKKPKNPMVRNLDCAVINTACELFEDDKQIDSVRGMFDESKPLYSGSGIHELDHVQICIRNPSICILGYFNPLV